MHSSDDLQDRAQKTGTLVFVPAEGEISLDDSILWSRMVLGVGRLCAQRLGFC